MTLTGRDGVGLDEVWSDGAHAYLGVTLPRFPNLFIVYGPNTNLGGGSIVSMIEAQTGYIAQAVQCLAGGERSSIEVREQVSDPREYQVLEAQPDVLEALKSQRFTKAIRRSIHLTPFGSDFVRATLIDSEEEFPEHGLPSEAGE